MRFRPFSRGVGWIQQGVIVEFVEGRLGVLPVGVEQFIEDFPDVLNELLFGELQYFLEFFEGRVDGIQEDERVEVIVLAYLPVITHKNIPLLQNTHIFLHFTMLGPSLEAF